MGLRSSGLRHVSESDLTENASLQSLLAESKVCLIRSSKILTHGRYNQVQIVPVLGEIGHSSLMTR